MEIQQPSSTETQAILNAIDHLITGTCCLMGEEQKTATTAFNEMRRKIEETGHASQAAVQTILNEAEAKLQAAHGDAFRGALKRLRGEVSQWKPANL